MTNHLQTEINLSQIFIIKTDERKLTDFGHK